MLLCRHHFPIMLQVASLIARQMDIHHQLSNGKKWKRIVRGPIFRILMALNLLWPVFLPSGTDALQWIASGAIAIEQLLVSSWWIARTVVSLLHSYFIRLLSKCCGYHLSQSDMQTDYTGLQSNTFIFFLTCLCVLMVFWYAEFRNAERFSLARKVFFTKWKWKSKKITQSQDTYLQKNKNK